VARGAAHADIDNAGAPDILVTTNGGPACLFHNVGGTEIPRSRDLPKGSYRENDRGAG
jgi:hypothetical protein